MNLPRYFSQAFIISAIGALKSLCSFYLPVVDYVQGCPVLLVCNFFAHHGFVLMIVKRARELEASGIPILFRGITGHGPMGAAHTFFFR